MKRFVAALVALMMMFAMAAYAEGYVYERDYFKDDHADQVKLIQQRLIELKYLKGGADGWFGDKTRSAIVQFQILNKLEPTGVADAAFQDAVFSDKAVKAPDIMMSLDELKKLMSSKVIKLVQYDLSDMAADQNSAAVELNNDVTLTADLIGDGVTKIELVGKGNVLVPFTVALMAFDTGIDESMMFSALDALKEEKQRAVGDKLIKYEIDVNQIERLIIEPFGGGSVAD